MPATEAPEPATRQRGDVPEMLLTTDPLGSGGWSSQRIGPSLRATLFRAPGRRHDHRATGEDGGDMRHAIIAATMSIAVPAGPASAEPRNYELDPEHTTVAFLVDHIGYAATLGRFGEVEGGFVYDTETQALSSVEIRVGTASVDTFHAARDGHVRSGDFLNVAEHPAMTFTADTGDPADSTSGSVTGTLTLLGRSRLLTLDVTLNKAAEYPFGHRRFALGISARGALKRSDFGMTYGVADGLVGDEVRIIVETEALRID